MCIRDSSGRKFHEYSSKMKAMTRCLERVRDVLDEEVVAARDNAGLSEGHGAVRDVLGDEAVAARNITGSSEGNGAEDAEDVQRLGELCVAWRQCGHYYREATKWRPQDNDALRVAMDAFSSKLAVVQLACHVEVEARDAETTEAEAYAASMFY